MSLETSLTSFNSKVKSIVPRSNRITQKDILTIVADKNKSENQLKEDIRELIVDKISDGIKLTDDAKIDICDCAWIAYQLNREAGRSRLQSGLLCTCVLASALGFVVFRRKNKLKDLVNLVYKTAKRPIWYFIVTWLNRSMFLFLPFLIKMLGYYLGFWKGTISSFKAVSPIILSMTMDPENGITPEVLGIDPKSPVFSGVKSGLVKAATYAGGGAILIGLGKFLAGLFTLIYTCYRLIVVYLNMSRDENSKVKVYDVKQGKNTKQIRRYAQ